MQRTIFYQSIIPGGYILSPPKPLNGEKTIYLKIYEFLKLSYRPGFSRIKTSTEKPTLFICKYKTQKDKTQKNIFKKLKTFA